MVASTQTTTAIRSWSSDPFCSHLCGYQKLVEGSWKFGNASNMLYVMANKHLILDQGCIGSGSQVPIGSQFTKCSFRKMYVRQSVAWSGEPNRRWERAIAAAACENAADSWSVPDQGCVPASSTGRGSHPLFAWSVCISVLLVPEQARNSPAMKLNLKPDPTLCGWWILM